MSEQDKKSQVQPLVPTAMPTNMEEKMNLLLQLLVTKEAREAEQAMALEASRKARNAQREKSSLAHVQKQLVKQARCRHMKGGKHGPISGVVDFAVSHHTYINGEQVIKCLICGMKWKINDTVDFLVRGGRKIANHTKTGWAEAAKMLQQSTNRPTSSEVPVSKPTAEFNGQEITGGLSGEVITEVN